MFSCFFFFYSRFFVNYGFALEDNEEDNEALLAFACPPDAPSLARKNQMAAGKNLLSLREFQVPATSGHMHAQAHACHVHVVADGRMTW